MSRSRRATEPHDATRSPLWPLTVLLGEIAQRIEQRRAEERTQETPETRRRAGSDPISRGEVGR